MDGEGITCTTEDGTAMACRKTITMREWEDKLDVFLEFNELKVLTHAGKISAQVAKRSALEQHATFGPPT